MTSGGTTTTGGPKGSIARAIEFCSGLDPSFSKGLRGASTQELTALEKVMGRSLSPTYREFLEHMGASTGKLDFGRFAVQPSVLLERRLGALTRLPTNVELLAMPTYDDLQDIFLVHGDGDAEPHVVRHLPLGHEGSMDFDDDHAEPRAGSLAEVICLAQLSRVALGQPHQVELFDEQSRKDRLTKAKGILESHKVAFHPWSNAWTVAGQAGPLIAVAKQAPGGALSVAVAGPSKNEVTELVDAMRTQLELVRWDERSVVMKRPTGEIRNE